MKEYAFISRGSPLPQFAFFAAAIIITMFFSHPLPLAVSFLCATSLALLLSRTKAIKTMLMLLPFMLLVMLINPLFSTGGASVLFMLGKRAYTLEALCWGASSALMLASVLMWFFSYNIVMTSDKFIYLFGRLLPSLSLVLSMVLRFVPNYERKLIQIATARACIGKGLSEGENTRGKIRHGALLVSVLTSWAFEGAIVTADSMRSRGYGTGVRTSFANFRFSAADGIFLSAVALLTALLLIMGGFGAFEATFIPNIVLQSGSLTTIGALCELLLFFAPSVFIITEEIRCFILISRS